MTLNISINTDYYITSDAHNVIVKKRKLVDPTKSANWEKRKKEGASPDKRESWEELSYTATIDQALDRIANKSILDSDATTLGQLRKEISQLRCEIRTILDDE